MGQRTYLVKLDGMSGSIISCTEVDKNVFTERLVGSDYCVSVSANNPKDAQRQAQAMYLVARGN